MNKFDGELYWKIVKARHPLKRIVEDIQRAGFKVEKTYRVFKNPYHRFFILKRIKM